MLPRATAATPESKKGDGAGHGGKDAAVSTAAQADRRHVPNMPCGATPLLRCASKHSAPFDSLTVIP